MTLLMGWVAWRIQIRKLESMERLPEPGGE